MREREREGGGEEEEKQGDKSHRREFVIIDNHYDLLGLQFNFFADALYPISGSGTLSKYWSVVFYEKVLRPLSLQHTSAVWLVINIDR